MKNQFKFGVLSLVVLMLASCGGTTTTNPTTAPTTTTETPTTTTEVTTVTTSETTTTVEPTSTPTSTISIPEGYKTNAELEIAKTTYVDENGKEQHLNRNTLYTNAGSPHLDSMSENHVLVIPFGFKNNKYDQSQERLDKIRTTFFGTDEEMEAVGAWKSVASYYNASSLGKGKFDGRMANAWCIWDRDESAACSGVTCAEYGVKWYAEEYAKENHGALGADAEPLSYFDANNDGFIDLCWVVYSHPTGSVSDWWAYVTYTSNSAGTHTSPKVKTLGWASIDWMDAHFKGYDAHTFIHETGHTFGLDDYYCYANGWSPMGKIDMMDGNVGDHNAYSKFELGWVNPMIADDNAIITLRSTALTGDCFVIPSTNYNKTAFDEYLMVEFVTPEGNNKQDYTVGYSGYQGYNQPGIRVIHVDARVYNSQCTRDSYLVENPWEGVDMRIGNTKGGRMGIKIDGDYWPDGQGSTTGKYMCHAGLIESTINETSNCLTDANYVATNYSLFKAGERLNFKNGGWAEVFMPSGTNLWNKAKTITSWNKTAQNFTVDESMTIDYKMQVLSIEKVDGEYQAVIKVDKTK